MTQRTLDRCRVQLGRANISRILLNKPFAQGILGLGDTILQCAPVDRHSTKINADDTGFLLYDRVFSMCEDRRASSASILLEGLTNTTNVQEKTALMLSQHLHMGVPASHNRSSLAVKENIQLFRRGGRQNIFRI